MPNLQYSHTKPSEYSTLSVMPNPQPLPVEMQNRAMQRTEPREKDLELMESKEQFHPIQDNVLNQNSQEIADANYALVQGI